MTSRKKGKNKGKLQGNDGGHCSGEIEKAIKI
jgi:hypothetical protein